MTTHEAGQTSPGPDGDTEVRLARAKKLNDRAFACAFISVFIPLAGILLSPFAIWLGVRSRRQGRALGVELSKSPIMFGIVMTAVWSFCWLLVLIPSIFA
ncbi:MAG: hypothetical protein WCP28_06830 [Actinomycetes bacterium]